MKQTNPEEHIPARLSNITLPITNASSTVVMTVVPGDSMSPQIFDKEPVIVIIAKNNGISVNVSVIKITRTRRHGSPILGIRRACQTASPTHNKHITKVDKIPILFFKTSTDVVEDGPHHPPPLRTIGYIDIPVITSQGRIARTASQIFQGMPGSLTGSERRLNLRISHAGIPIIKSIIINRTIK